MIALVVGACSIVVLWFVLSALVMWSRYIRACRDIGDWDLIEEIPRGLWLGGIATIDLVIVSELYFWSHELFWLGVIGWIAWRVVRYLDLRQARPVTPAVERRQWTEDDW